MATDSIKNSSDEEISFSEWQFVVKNKGECSDDDESIEVIEREVLQSVTPSSCSEDENENEKENEIDNDKENYAEIEDIDWEVSEDGRVHFYKKESDLNSSMEVNSDQNDANNSLCASEDSHVAATTINNHFSRKVLYSCVLAAVISVVIHQYRGNLLDILNRVYAKSKVGDSQNGAPIVYAELRKQPTVFEIQSDDELMKDLVERRAQIKIRGEKYELILRNTFVPTSHSYVVDYSILYEVLDGGYDETIVSYPCTVDLYDQQPPIFCTESSGKTLMILKADQYYLVMRTVLKALESSYRNELRDTLRDLKSDYYEFPLQLARREVFGENSHDELSSEINRENIPTNELFDDPIKDDMTTNTVEVDVSEVRENPNDELSSEIIQEHIQTNELFDDPMKDDTTATNTIETDVPEIRENPNDELSSEINQEHIQTNELFDDSMKDDTTAKNAVETDVPEIRENTAGVELQIQEIIEEIRTLGRKIKTQVDDFHRLWTTCNKNEPNSCLSKNESPELNDTSTTESEKFNVTHTEETNSASVSDFIYNSAPITDRWSEKVDFKPSQDSKHQEKANGEWLLKLGKAREKYRNKRYKEKSFKKKTHKSNDKEKPVHEMYKRYREFITRTREKLKVDYKKYATHFKSKLKKFGDGMKRSYEKFISSDWKHYARSVFFPFRF